MLRVDARWSCKIFLTLDSKEPKLEDGAPTIMFFPSINQVEHAVIGPNSLLYFLVNTDAFWATKTTLELLRRAKKQTVLCEFSLRS